MQMQKLTVRQFFKKVKHIKQADLARAAKAHPVYINDIAAGRKVPTAETVKRLNDAVDMIETDLAEKLFKFRIK
jgi:transcriptional regulator with XRE-family HTH domain